MRNISEYIKDRYKKCIFVVIKPGFLDKSSHILEIFKENGWEMQKTIVKQLLLKEAKKLYQIHKGKDFYEELCKYMSSSPCRAIIFKNPSSSDPFEETKVIKDEIRNMYGESDMRNVLHSSDSKDNMEHEMSIFFA